MKSSSTNNPRDPTIRDPTPPPQPGCSQGQRRRPRAVDEQGLGRQGVVVVGSVVVVDVVDVVLVEVVRAARHRRRGGAPARTTRRGPAAEKSADDQDHTKENDPSRHGCRQAIDVPPIARLLRSPISSAVHGSEHHRPHGDATRGHGPGIGVGGLHRRRNQRELHTTPARRRAPGGTSPRSHAR